MKGKLPERGLIKMDEWSILTATKQEVVEMTEEVRLKYKWIRDLEDYYANKVNQDNAVA